MTTEEDFQNALDADPSDSQTRLVFADWLDEHDDPRAAGYRALGELRLYPVQDTREDMIMRTSYAYHCWFFWSAGSADLPRHQPEFALPTNRLPEVWVSHVLYLRLNKHDNWQWVGYEKRRAVVENKAALAFKGISARDRARILTEGEAFIR